MRDLDRVAVDGRTYIELRAPSDTRRFLETINRES